MFCYVLSSHYVNPGKNEPINEHAIECRGYLIPALKLTHCALICTCIQFNSCTLSNEGPQTMIQVLFDHRLVNVSRKEITY
jgi:hypothetical protein